MAAPTKKILVIPGTTLVGLEVLKSLESLPGFVVHGAGFDVSAGHKAGFAAYDYLPPVYSEGFASKVSSLVRRDSIDYVYPANDLAISVLAELRFRLTVVVSHPPETVRITGSKIATHSYFSESQITPTRFITEPDVALFPVFSKPDVGHSSIGAVMLRDRAALQELSTSTDDFWGTHLVTEMLLTDEVTVDCFSTTSQGLVFTAPRTRDLAEGGVSLVTTDYADQQLANIAKLINDKLTFNGPWFFQAKRDAGGIFRLMEIGARLAGASGIRRAQGVNLAQMAILVSDNVPISVYRSTFAFRSRRAHDTSEIECEELFTALYVDLDDTLILNGSVNKVVEELARYVKNLGCYVAIITRHAQDPQATLREFGLEGIFDDIFHLTNGESKAAYIRGNRNSVLIDDSFSERVSCSLNNKILAVDASSANQLRKLFGSDG